MLDLEAQSSAGPPTPAAFEDGDRAQQQNDAMDSLRPPMSEGPIARAEHVLLRLCLLKIRSYTGNGLYTGPMTWLRKMRPGAAGSDARPGCGTGARRHGGFTEDPAADASVRCTLSNKLALPVR